MADMMAHIHRLRTKAIEIQDPALLAMALTILADMEFTVGQASGEELPIMDSRVTQRERHTFNSATAWVEALASLSDGPTSDGRRTVG